MPNIKEIMQNVNIDNMIACLLNESEPVNGKIEISDTTIQDSYKEFTEKIIELYPSANKDDDDLFDAITEFASIHDEIYFKMGVIVGAGLAKELNEEYEEIKRSGNVK